MDKVLTKKLAHKELNKEILEAVEQKTLSPDASQLCWTGKIKRSVSQPKAEKSGPPPAAGHLLP